MKPIFLIPALIATMVVGAPAIAKKKPWDMARYTECLTVTGDSPFDLAIEISSAECRGWRNVVQQSENYSGKAEVKAPIVGFRDKKTLLTDLYVTFVITSYTGSTLYKGSNVTSSNERGYNIKQVTMVIDGSPKVVPLASSDRLSPQCGSMNRGRLSSSMCIYKTMSSITVTNEMKHIAQTQYDIDVESEMLFKIFSDGGANWIVSVPVAEILAVDAALRPTP